ncbi:hypothetical protein BVRB_7g177470 [Beta vulgaris subsp. vulgaris]|uniref:RNase H type-1 domain-containing protein n=1 Tax=Beta vulgaris subsp. vulgaris TaxID=3555 RepID=A0A0J8B7J7_BETVV|nr:hypothetical protein BVRB_7g177470 [Beta vulgaris subsp. vulgaris]
MSRRKKGQSPFAQCGGDETEAKPVPKQGERKQVISERMTLPVQKINDSKISSVPLRGFEKSSEMPSARKEGFDPVAYKLMENSGHDFSNPEPMGKVIEAKAYGLSKTRQNLQEQGKRVFVKKVGLGFTESKPVRITARRKPIQATQYIAVEELEESEGENTLPVRMESVFDRIKPASIQPRYSVFDRLEEREKSSSSSLILQRLAGRRKDATPFSSKRSVFNRLGKDTQCKKSVFSRMGKSKVNSKQQWRRKDGIKVEDEFKLEKEKAIKGQALADFLADHPTPSDWELSDDLPREEVFYIDILPPWEMYFDGAARQDGAGAGAGAGVILISPEKHILTYSFVLTELCSNNVAEYQAFIFGLQMAKEMEIQDLDVYGDSKLVIHQLLNDYDVKKEDLIPYHRHASQLLETFHSVKLQHVPRSANKMADALSNLAATLALGA